MALVPDELNLLILKSRLSVTLNIRHEVGLEDLINTFMVDGPSRSLGHVVQRHLRHIQVGVKSFDLMKALLKAVIVAVAELGKESVKVMKLCRPIFLSPSDLLP